LYAVGQAEVIRRSVFYEHPQLSGSPDPKGESALSAADMSRR
jgi:hypothetical protein